MHSKIRAKILVGVTVAAIAIAVGLAFIPTEGDKSAHASDASKIWLAQQERTVSAPSLQEAQQRLADERDTMLVHAATSINLNLKRRLLNPDSLKIAEAYQMEDGAVCVSYRGENGLGGYAAGQAVYSYVDNSLLMESDSGFVRAWKQECRDRVAAQDATVSLQAMLH